MRPLRLLLTLLISACALPCARAHLPNESSLVLSIDEENLEVIVSLSLPSAASLLPADAEPLRSGNLEQYRPALHAAVSRVCALLDAQGAPIPADRVFIGVRDEHELRFQLLFPAAARPARVRMPLLPALPAGAFCTVSDLRRLPPLTGVLTVAAPELSLATLPR